MPSRRSGPVRKGKRREPSYNYYIHKVLKDVDARFGITGRATNIMNSFMADMFGRIAAEASRLATYNGKVTMTPREIQTAVRLLVPGDLGKLAVAAGAKAVMKYSAL